MPDGNKRTQCKLIYLFSYRYTKFFLHALAEPVSKRPLIWLTHMCSPLKWTCSTSRRSQDTDMSLAFSLKLCFYLQARSEICFNLKGTQCRFLLRCGTRPAASLTELCRGSDSGGAPAEPRPYFTAPVVSKKAAAAETDCFRTLKWQRIPQHALKKWNMLIVKENKAVASALLLQQKSLQPWVCVTPRLRDKLCM